MTTFFVLTAAIGLFLAWAMGTSSRRNYREYEADEWDRHYPPHYPRYPYPPYPPYPPRRRESESMLVLLSLVLIILLAFIVVRYVYEKEEEKRIEKMRDRDWTPPGDGVDTDKDDPVDHIGGDSLNNIVEYKESNLNISPEEAAKGWFLQVDQRGTEPKAREQIKKVSDKFAGKRWLGINNSFDTQPYKVLIGPFSSEHDAREALEGDYPVRRPAQENIEIYRAD